MTVYFPSLWVHRIPATYVDKRVRETVVVREMPEKCPKCGCTHLHQDEDTLIPGSACTPGHSPHLAGRTKTPELESISILRMLVTGYDIIFFVIRKVFSAPLSRLQNLFHHVLIHGLQETQDVK